MELLINENDIKKAITRTATSICRSNPKGAIFICLLNGGFLYYSELVKRINYDVKCDFMRVKSYTGKNEQGEIKITKDIETNIEGKIVYIVDDIFDSGNTINNIIKHLELKNPQEIRIATLLRRKSSPTLFKYLHHSSIEIDDEWVIGMGMDDENGYYRNDMNIYKI